jgi:hypothetical protein
VLLGTWGFRVLGAWWEFSGGRGGYMASSFSSTRPCRPSFSFLLFFVCFLLGVLVLMPQQLYRVTIVPCGCYINIAGRKSILSVIFLGVVVLDGRLLRKVERGCVCCC